jgi:hypothetical protein
VPYESLTARESLRSDREYVDFGPCLDGIGHAVALFFYVGHQVAEIDRISRMAWPGEASALTYGGQAVRLESNEQLWIVFAHQFIEPWVTEELQRAREAARRQGLSPNSAGVISQYSPTGNMTLLIDMFY